MTEFKIPYGRQNIQQDDLDAVNKVLTGDFLTQGPKIKEFEDKFAAYVGADYAVAVSNATAGLHLAMLALNLKQGQRVITTPITFAASANCVRYAKGEVWFSDIDPNTYLIDLKATKLLIESKPKGFFSGLILVDFAGLPVDLQQFKKLAEEHGLWLVEDACHAPGGYFTDSNEEKIKCGQGVYSDLSVFSFHPVKHIACGEGGMITTNNRELYKKLMMLRTHGITKENLSKNDGGWYYEMQSLGYNYRLTDFQAALGITQLTKNPEGVDRRNEIASRYKNAFQGKIRFQATPAGCYHAYHLFVIEVEDRRGLYDHLKEKGIYSQIHYIPVHQLSYYERIGYTAANLVNSEKYYSRCLSLPMFPSLTVKEQNYVIQTVFSYTNG